MHTGWPQPVTALPPAGRETVPMNNNILDLLWSVGAALSLGFTVYGAFLIGLARERGMPEERALSHKVRPCAN